MTKRTFNVSEFLFNGVLPVLIVVMTVSVACYLIFNIFGRTDRFKREVVTGGATVYTDTQTGVQYLAGLSGICVIVDADGNPLTEEIGNE